MSLAPASIPQPARMPWERIVLFGSLLVLCYAPVLSALARQWYHDEDMGHGFFVPVVAVYIAWQRREELLRIVPRPNWWGLALVVFGAAQSYAAMLGAELFLGRTAFIVSLTGMVWFLGGTAVLRLLGFPLFLLLFMVPIPAIVYGKITFPLQLLASRLADAALMGMGVPVLREGNILELANQRLSVVEACSGIRSLLSLTFLSVVYGHFLERRRWLQVVLFLATLPIAICANAGRVTVTGLLSQFKPELADGFFHTASGWVIFMAALFILVVFHRAVLGMLKLAARAWAK
ncbi:MAG: exosortase [Bryobacteraceae bacterium]